MDLTKYLKAGYPALYIVTHEPERATASIETGDFEKLCWDCLRGITEPSGRIIEDTPDPLSALKWLGNRNDTVLFAQNFHHFIGSVEIIQEIQNSLPIWKASGCCLAMVGPQMLLPIEVEKYFTILDFPLPSLMDIFKMQEELGESVGVQTDMGAAESALGLTEHESETAFALSLVEKKRFCTEIVTKQKQQMIRRTGLMEFWPPVSVRSSRRIGPFETVHQEQGKSLQVGGRTPSQAESDTPCRCARKRKITDLQGGGIHPRLAPDPAGHLGTQRKPCRRI